MQYAAEGIALQAWPWVVGMELTPLEALGRVQLLLRLGPKF